MVWISYRPTQRANGKIKDLKAKQSKMRMSSKKNTLKSKGVVQENGSQINLLEALLRAVSKNVPPKEKFGIAFSGGIDSGVIAFLAGKFSKNATLLSVGFPTSSDLARVKPLANKMKMKIITHTLTEKEIVENYAQAAKLLKTKDELQCTLGAVNISIATLAQKKGLRIVLVGSGADELFCGYGAFEQVRDDEKTCEKMRAEKVANVEEHDVKREKICAEAHGVEVRAPFLEKEFVKVAMQIPAIENLQGKYGKIRKNHLRLLAEKMGVPREIVEAPKKAMQYGSGARKVIVRHG